MVQTLQFNNATVEKMSPENFCYWLQGLFELQPDLKELTPAQVQMIRQHLMYVFEGKVTHMTPSPTPGQGSNVSYYPAGLDLVTTVC